MMADPLEDREIVTTRLIDAPRQLVFAAFTRREHVEKWWAPRGATTREWRDNPGGLWRYSMPGPDGTPATFKVDFIEMDEPVRLVYDYGPDVANAPDPVRTIVTFEEENGKTRVTLRLLFATADARDTAVKYGAAAGARRALTSLADYLTTLPL